MSQTTNLSTLKINKFSSEEQYKQAAENGLVGEFDLNLTPDLSNGITQEQADQKYVSRTSPGGVTISCADEENGLGYFIIKDGFLGLITKDCNNEGILIEAMGDANNRELCFWGTEEDQPVRLYNIAAPINGADAANKQYVDSKVQEISTGITKTLLWQNASTGSDFRGQSIPIVQINQYQEIEVEFIINTAWIGNTSRGCMMVRATVSTDLDSMVHKLFPNGLAYAHLSSSQTVERKFCRSAQTSAIIFGECINAGATGSTVISGGLIPFRIYGIKGVKLL